MRGLWWTSRSVNVFSFRCFHATWYPWVIAERMESELRMNLGREVGVCKPKRTSKCHIISSKYCRIRSMVYLSRHFFDGVKSNSAMCLERNNCDLFHDRMGHASESPISNTVKIFNGIVIIPFHLSDICTTWKLWNFRRHPRPERSVESKSSTYDLYLVHCDL